MCGISAYIGFEKCYNIVLESLKNLSNRGYDSTGIMLNNISEKNLHLFKEATNDNNYAIDLLENDLINNKDIIENCDVSIGHTRWATHGIKNVTNSHPHIDNSKKLFLVHNGIIENYKDLKNFLINKGYSFYSDTDTEVIVNLLSYHYKNNDIVDAINKTMCELQGTFGVCFYNIEEPNKLYCFKRGSPILISINENFAMISSEMSGFNNLTNKYFVLNNNDYCVITKTTDSIEFVCKHSYISKEIDDSIKTNNKNGYEHWTLKEIKEQPVTINNAMNNSARIKDEYNVKLGGLESYKDKLMDVDNIILLGCGTSYYASKIGAKYINSLCDYNIVMALDGCEFNIEDLPKNGKTIAILLSQSGETRDLYNCIEILKKQNILTIGCINVIDSLLSREVDCGVYLNAGKEVGVASTKSFTSQLIVLNLIANWLCGLHKNNSLKCKKYIEALRNISFEINNILLNYDMIKEHAKKITHDNIFILGKGKLYNIAEEGALKIKELSYCHAEAYSGSALKHGPFSLLKKDFPVILLINDDEHYHKMYSVYEEIKSREANILVITNIETFDHDNKIYIHSKSILNELLYIIPLQIISYEMSKNRDINPDYPRNLAKVVTVE